MIAFAVPALHLFQCSCPTLRIPLLRGKREVSQDLSEFQEHVMGQNLLCIKCMYIYTYVCICMYMYVFMYIYIHYKLEIHIIIKCVYIYREREKKKTRPIRGEHLFPSCFGVHQGTRVLMLTHFTAAAENNTQQHRAFFTLLVWLPPRLPNCAWNDRRVALSIACDSKWNTHTRISEEFSRSLRTFYHNRHLISLDLTCTFRVLKHKSHIALPSRLWRTWKGKRLLKNMRCSKALPLGIRVSNYNV